MSELKPGRALDALVAEKVFGETFRPYASVLTSYPGKSLPETPFYSTDIAAAWTVVEKLVKGPYAVQIEDGYYCAFMDLDLRSSKFETEYRAQAGTAPHAICLAALKVMESNVDEVLDTHEDLLKKLED